MTLRTPLFCVLLLVNLAAQALAQPVPRPVKKGRKYAVKIDSAPQQAALYLDDKKYGIIGYTPYSGKLVQGDYKLIVELQGFKATERIIRIDRSSRDFFVPLEREIKPATIDVQAAADPNVLGAQVFIDGQPQGTAPATVDVPAGRHLVELKKPGFVDLSQWISAREGERVTITPVLRGGGRGSLLVDADVPQAEVVVDGKVAPDTTPTLIENLDEGPHLVEVRKAPAVPWKQTVVVKAGQRTKITAELSATFSKGGNIRVLSNVDGAEVWLDGQQRGVTPMDLTDVPPGVHLVEVKARGYATREERVTINVGSAAVVKLDLSPGSGKMGSLKIVSPVPEAKVFIDGAEAGMAPVEKPVSAGEHFVLVERPGYAKFEQKVTVEGGQDLVVTAELKSVGALRFLANVDGADVVIDGEVVGKTPLVKEDVAVGDHIVTVRQMGYHDYEQPVKVEVGKLVIVNAELKMIDTSLSDEDTQKQRRGLTSFGARTTPPGRFTADAAGGYPYFVEARATVGVAELDKIGIDVGVGFRSLLTTWEFLGHVRARLFQQGPFAFGAFSAAGGGGGFHGRNSFTFQGGALASLTFQNLVTVTGRAFLDVWSDRLCGKPKKRDVDGIPDDGPEVCTGTFDDMSTAPAKFARAAELLDLDSVSGPLDLQGRDTGVRFYLSFVAEAAVTPNLGFFIIFEGAPGQGERAAHTDLFNRQMAEEDQIYNVKGGVSAKF